jgi:four helix bundle protein
MANWKTFEEILAWQKARELCKKIYEITRKTEFSKDWELKNQIRASSGSIMDNIAEGFERNGNKEFIYFLGISKGSTGEVRSQAYRAIDASYISQIEFDEISIATIEIGKMLSGLISYLKNTETKGFKFEKMEEEELNRIQKGNNRKNPF